MLNTLGRYISGSVSEQGRFVFAATDETGMNVLGGLGTTIPQLVIEPQLYAPTFNPQQEHVPVLELSANMYDAPSLAAITTVGTSVLSVSTHAPKAVAVMNMEPIEFSLQIFKPTGYRPSTSVPKAIIALTFTPNNKRFIRSGA